MSEYLTICTTSELGPGQSKVVIAGKDHIALFNVDGTYHAIDNRCPHAYGPLGEGDLEDKVVSCPLHGWTFDVTTGECEFMPGVKVYCYPVRVDGEQIQVEVGDNPNAF